MVGPYRLPVDQAQPVCARCVHRRDANMMDEKDPWLDWRCDVQFGREWPAEYNPITGVTKPGWRAREVCIKVNNDGQCQLFEPVTIDPSSEQPEPEPEERPAELHPWWSRAFDWIAAKVFG